MNTAAKHLFWNKHLADWSRSGLSQKAYCLQQGLKPTTFSYWRKCLRSTDGACGKLIRLPILAGNHSVRITILGVSCCFIASPPHCSTQSTGKQLMLRPKTKQLKNAIKHVNGKACRF